MKSHITNITYFDIRRVDIKFQLSLTEDLENIEQSLIHLSEQNNLILDEPRPLFIVEGLVENLVKIQFSFWVQKDNYLKIKNNFCAEMLKLFRNLNIVVPTSRTYMIADNHQGQRPPLIQPKG